MKRIIIFLFFVFNVSYSQQTWEITSIDSSTSRYDDVFFLNENLGWAADGWGASVYKTVDGGENWDLQYSEQGINYFRNVEFLNENIGFLGTLYGNFYKTIDGGANWNAVTNISPLPEAICGLDCVGNSTIYGCGAYFQPAYIIKSIDSGATWQYIDMSNYATALVEVLFTTETIGYASGKNAQGAVILKTVNGGQSWSTIYNGQISGEYVWKLQILESNPNVMFGSVESVAPFNGKLIKSINAGLSWVSREVPDTDIQAVGFVSESHGWMGGHNSGFLETFDSGQTWINTGIATNLNRIFFVNNNAAYACGDSVYKMVDNLSTVSTESNPRKSILIKIIPNPIKDKLNIEVDYTTVDNLLLELYSTDGKLIKQIIRDTKIPKGLKKYSLDFPFPKGNYILNFHTNTGRESIKIIK